MGISTKNAEGYSDPTAYEAVRRIEEQEYAKSVFRPLVYICSPLSGDVPGNQERARKYSRFAVDKGAIPLAPHLLFPQFMDDSDPAERDLALYMDIILLSKCGEVWVFGETISRGMAVEIEKAKRKGKPIRYFDRDCKEVTQ